jgi:hypothetical protein
VTPWDFFGYASGLLSGYLCWKLPYQAQALRDRRARRIRAEIDRIEGGFALHLYTPIQAPPPSWRERFLEWCSAWRDDWNDGPSPRTPEKVAELAYLRELRR